MSVFLGYSYVALGFMSAAIAHIYLAPVSPVNSVAGNVWATAGFIYAAAAYFNFKTADVTRKSK